VSDVTVPIFVVSLERAADRRTFVERAFATVGASVEVVPAVDARNLSAVDIGRYSSRRAMFEYGRELNRGELACALSHLKVLEIVCERGLESAVVFEDDTRPLPEFLDVVRATAAAVPRDSVVTFHSLFPGSGPTPVPDDALPTGHRLCRYRRTPMGTQAYLIRRGAAERVLDVAFPVGLPSDELLFRPRPAGLDVYGIEPAPVVQEDFPSEIRTPMAPITEHGAAGRSLLQLTSIAGRVRHRVRRRNARASSS
jgi:glycosyl transferase family 25